MDDHRPPEKQFEAVHFGLDHRSGQGEMEPLALLLEGDASETTHQLHGNPPPEPGIFR